MTHPKILILLALTAGVLLAEGTPRASALTIIRTYIGPGEQFETVNGPVTAGAAPMNVVGRGTLIDIFNAAADSWERAIRDAHTVAIQFGWSPMPLGSGMHNVRAQGGAPNRVTEAVVYFDNDGSTVWFLDPGPREHTEYKASIECYATIGGQRINSGRMLSSGIGSAQAFDLLTIAKHEIGHAIGLSTWNNLWDAKNTDQGILLSAPRPYAGSVIPTIDGGHLGIEGTLMGRGLLTGQRKLMSVVDVLTIAELGEFIDLNLNPDADMKGSAGLRQPNLGIGC